MRHAIRNYKTQQWQQFGAGFTVPSGLMQWKQQSQQPWSPQHPQGQVQTGPGQHGVGVVVVVVVVDVVVVVGASVQSESPPGR